jgi:hypothetical protein
MHIDHSAARTMQNTIRRSRTARPWLQLLSSLLALGQGKAELLRHGERPWASATFSGTRHTVLLAFSGADGVLTGEQFIALLPDHEFTIPGQLVADATIVSAEHTALPHPRLVVEAEFLLLDEG